jgi:hypothetical protein
MQLILFKAKNFVIKGWRFFLHRGAKKCAERIIKRRKLETND